MSTDDFQFDGHPADGPVRGRGAQLNPGNRFERHHFAADGDHLDLIRTARNAAGAGAEAGAEAEADGLGPTASGGKTASRIALPILDQAEPRGLPGRASRTAPRDQPLLSETFTASGGVQVTTRVQRGASRSIINRVDSPDLGLDWTINPYRGCEHGCIYCYARPTHETLGFSSGLDFETRILAKPDAPRLLRKELSRARWRGEPIAMSGVTDPYQPAEAKLGITRQCLEEMVRARQPVSIITKSRLVLRDMDLLAELARYDAVRVYLSITTLDAPLAAAMEPRASAPRDRLWAVRRLASAGIPVGVMVAPVIPALTDREMPAILQTAAEAGARSAGYVLLRLPHQNKALFEDWLQRHAPGRRAHVLNRIRDSRGGELYDADWHRRLTGTGPYAEQIGRTFALFKRRHGLDRGLPPLSRAAFRKPVDHEQLDLFADDAPTRDARMSVRPVRRWTKR